MSAAELDDSQKEACSSFCGITGANEERAHALLEACNWNLELAINMHMDTDPEGRSNRDAVTATAAEATLQQTLPSSDITDPARSFINHDGSHPMIGIDEDRDGSEDDRESRGGRFVSRANRSIDQRAIRRFVAGTSSSSSSRPNAGRLYTDFQPDADGVRPPIAPIRQILNPNPIGFPSPDMPMMRRFARGGPGEVHDAFRDFQAEANYQEILQGEGENAAETSGNGRMTIDQLFRPPLSLMFRGSLASAREVGAEQNKWLLVNIQSGSEFNCQILNRDVWSNQAVKDIIRENFIFWQVYHDSYEGQRYVRYYHAVKLPHVAIIDPRTGELMKSWPTSIDHTSFCDSVTEFLLDHPTPDGTSGDNVGADVIITDTISANGASSAKAKVQQLDTKADDHLKAANNQNEESTGPSVAKVPKIKPRPETITGPECKIALRFPDGSSLMQRFGASEKLKDVRDFVQMEKTSFATSQIEFVAPPNRKFTDSMMDETLESLGLCPASRLEVKCVQH